MDEIKEIYSEQWQIDNLKDTLEPENFTRLISNYDKEVHFIEITVKVIAK